MSVFVQGSSQTGDMPAVHDVKDQSIFHQISAILLQPATDTEGDTLKLQVETFSIFQFDKIPHLFSAESHILYRASYTVILVQVRILINYYKNLDTPTNFRITRPSGLWMSSRDKNCKRLDAVRGCWLSIADLNHAWRVASADLQRLNIWCHLIRLLIIWSWVFSGDFVKICKNYGQSSVFVAHSISSVSSRAAAALAKVLTSSIDEQLLRWCSNLFQNSDSFKHLWTFLSNYGFITSQDWTSIPHIVLASWFIFISKLCVLMCVVVPRQPM